MKYATKTVTLLTGNSGNIYQNTIDLSDIGLDTNKIIACFFEPTNSWIGLSSTAGGACTISKQYNSNTGQLIVNISSSQYCREMTWEGVIVAISA